MSTVEFGSLFEFIRNGMSVKQDKSGKGLPISRIETIWNSSIDTERVGYAGLKESDVEEWLLSPGDILFSHINSVEHIGKCAVFEGKPEKLVHGMNLLCLRCDPKKIVPAYAKHLIRSVEFRKKLRNFINKAVNQASVSIGNLKKIEVSIAPLPEQRRIAAILDKADALRAQRREALTQLERLGQSFFLKMFGDPISNPKHWPLLDFGDLCSRVTVGIVVQPASYYQPSGVIALRSLNIKPGKISLDNVVYFSEQDNETKLVKTRLRTGDLVLVRSGQPGTAAVVPEALDGVNAIDILIASPITEKCNATYLCEFFNSKGGRSLVLSAQRGQIQKHLNVGSLNSALIPVPPIELQNEFANRIEQIKELIVEHSNALEKLEELITSLQHRASNGTL